MVDIVDIADIVSIKCALQKGDDSLVKELLSYIVNNYKFREYAVWENFTLIHTLGTYANAGVLTFLLKLGSNPDYAHRVKWLIRIFAEVDRVDMIDWIFKWSEEHDVCIYWNMYARITYGVKSSAMLDCLHGHGWRPSCDDIRTAIYDNNLMISVWCFEHGYTQTCIYDGLMSMFSTKSLSREMLRLLHEHSIEEKYQLDCKATKCPVCVERALCALWEMDYDVFENTVQWLPREILEDIVECL